MLKIKKTPVKEFDCCVLCGKKTEYTRDVLIDKRIGYIEGAGQLCRKCFMDTYPKGKDCHG